MEKPGKEQPGNYRFIRPLGEGGFAQVYLGEHISLKHRVAIKVLRALLAQDDQESFLRESQVIGRLKHPHILPLYESGVQEGIPFLVMPYAAGGTIRQRHPRRTCLTPVTILPYIQQIASALYYVHSHGIVHRDLKPENMLLDLSGTLYLSDFGLAIGQQSSRTQSMKEVAGAAVYMAPELLQGKALPASDQYALAIVVYEWLCGEPPFEGSFIEVANKQFSAPAPPMKPLSVSPEVEAVIMTALAKNPEGRFENIQAFANAFEQAALLDEETVRARPGSSPIPPLSNASRSSQATRAAPFIRPPSSPLAATQPVSPSSPAFMATQPATGEAQRHKPGHSRFRAAIAIVLALLVICGGIGLAYFGAVLHPARLAAEATAAAQTRQAQQIQQAQATARAQQELYKQVTSGQIALDDPLSKNNAATTWTIYRDKTGSCVFTGGSLHVSDFESYLPAYCDAYENARNFAFQVQMTILKGDEGGITFRESIQGNGLRLYEFIIDQHGFYVLNGTFPTNDTKSPFLINPLLHRSSPAIKTGLNQPNLLTVIAQGSTIFLYINQQFVGEVSDSGSSSGYLGVMAWATPDPTEVAFSNAKVWLI